MKLAKWEQCWVNKAQYSRLARVMNAMLLQDDAVERPQAKQGESSAQTTDNEADNDQSYH